MTSTIYDKPTYTPISVFLSVCMTTSTRYGKNSCKQLWCGKAFVFVDYHNYMSLESFEPWA